MDIQSLPYFTPLVKDYLGDFAGTSIGEFFSIPPDIDRDPESERAFRKLLETPREASDSNREAVVEEIRTFHQRLGLTSRSVDESLKALADPKTLAVVTGQQVSLMGGPLYTFYKTYSAILFARKLSAKYPDRRFVPIFWLETEDHDLNEASWLKVLNKEGDLQRISYLPPRRTGEPTDGTWRKQIGPTPLDGESIAKTIESIATSLQPTEFTQELIATLSRCYTPDKTFAEAFAQLLFTYFESDGLLIFDANNARMKALAKPIFWKELETTPELSEKIVVKSIRVEELYHAQIKPKALNLFYVTDEGERLPIVEKERTPANPSRSFFLKGTRKFFTLKEMKQMLEVHPERFSPNVTLRPLVQDTLLPTIAYVAGPGEIAYFAQLRGAYEWAGLPMPLIQPRITATLVEERFEKIFQKFSITAEDILTEGLGKMNALLEALIDPELTSDFERAIAAIDRELESLRESVKETDVTLDAALTNMKGKVLTTIRDFQGKALSAERKRHTATKSKLDKLHYSLLPEGELQERELSLIYFVNKYGTNFLPQLKERLEAASGDIGEHLVIHLADAFQGADRRRPAATLAAAL